MAYYAQETFTPIAAVPEPNPLGIFAGKVECFAHTNWWVTTVSGPCETFTPPARVALGERFAANGKEHQIAVIVASQAEKDMLKDGLDIRKGDWTCVAAESLSNIPSDENQEPNMALDRKCQPAAMP